MADNAMIYMVTRGPRYTPGELDQLAEIKEFAQREGWELSGALVDPVRPTALFLNLIEDYRAGKIDALIMWDGGLGQPVAWANGEEPSHMKQTGLCDAYYGTGNTDRPAAYCVREEGHPEVFADGIGHSYEEHMRWK